MLISYITALTSCSKDESKDFTIDYSLIIGSWSEFSESQGENVSGSTGII